MRLRAGALLAAAIVLGAAYGPPADPDWPCMQRLVPTLVAASLWTGPAPSSDWRADPGIAALVAEVAPRDVSAEDGVAKLDAFVATHPSTDSLARVFEGLVDETNAQRGEVIERLRGIGHRQHALVDRTQRVAAELHALPADAPQAQRDEITDRRKLMLREYESIDRTIRYACEAPSQLENRLGQFGRALERGLPQ